MRIRRIILRVSVFVLLGAVVNVAVAWERAFNEPEFPTGFGARAMGLLERTAHWRRLAPGESADIPVPFGFDSAVPAASRIILMTNDPHGVVCQSGTIDTMRQLWVEQESFGWPQRSLAFRRHWRNECGGLVDHQTHPVIPLRTVALPNAGPVVVAHGLPMLPLWPGFAVNTIIYAVCLWLLLITSRGLHRFIRIKRRRCAACGYRIAKGVGPVCSECGHPLPAPKP